MKRFLLTLLALPVCALADGGLPTQPYIYVEGRAEIEKPADMVTLEFELSAMEPDQSAANKVVQAQALQVFAFLKTVGIADNDVVASDLDSEAEYDEEEGTRKKSKLIGYRVTRPFTVRVREVVKFPKVVDQLLALKVHEFSSIREGLSNSREMEEQAWDKAVANARERAEKTLRSTGAKIESIFAVSPVAFPEIRRSIFGGEDDANREQFSPMAMEEGQLSQYRLAPVSISQSVHVIYLISGGK